MPRLTCCVSLGFLLLPLLPLVADADEYEEPRRNGLQAHAWALEFEVDPRFGGPGGSATISGKYHMSAASAVRLGFSIQVSTGDDESKSYSVEDTLVTPRGQGRSDSDTQTYNLFAHFVRYTNVGSRLAVFGFTGPTVRRGWSRNLSRFQYAGSPDYAVYRNEGRSLGVGADLGAGFEYFFSRRFSLGARYGLVYLYNDLKYHRVSEQHSGTFTGRSIEDSRSHGFTIQSTTTVIMLSAYF